MFFRKSEVLSHQIVNRRCIKPRRHCKYYIVNSSQLGNVKGTGQKRGVLGQNHILPKRGSTEIPTFHFLGWDKTLKFCPIFCPVLSQKCILLILYISYTLLKFQRATEFLHPFFTYTYRKPWDKITVNQRKKGTVKCLK